MLELNRSFHWEDLITEKRHKGCIGLRLADMERRLRMSDLLAPGTWR